MSSYGHFILEVKIKNEWKRIYWKSDMSIRSYISEEEAKQDEYVHKYLTVGQFYTLRDYVRNGELGHTFKDGDFTKDTVDEIDELTKEYCWYEGFFTLKELNDFIAEKVREQDEYKKRNMLQAIFDEVRTISAKLNNTDFKKNKEEEIPFDSYYDEQIEYTDTEINSLKYISCCMDFLADEIVGYNEPENIRVILIAG